MDVLLSAVASEFVARLFSFLIEKYQDHERGTTDTAGRLQRALVRARVVVEEAEGRQIANRAMLQQLNQLRREMCRAIYALDSFRWRPNDSSRSRRWQATVRRSRSHRGSPPSINCSDVMVENLEASLSDMREFLVLLNGCPRVTRQPYSAYLFVENCMFGRQMEKEEIIGFLLKPSQDLDVLPIIGPREVGKRTLVEHVCLDERVRGRFPEIHRLRGDELALHGHENNWSLFDFTVRSLMVINIIDSDTNTEESWRRFYSAVRQHAHGGSKILFMSRTEAHISLGTVPPLRLQALRWEEHWYFFRALAFGAADPDDRPDLARIAMALCEGMSHFAGFAAANITAASLRTDLNARSWRRVLNLYVQETLLQLDAAGDGFDDEDKLGRYYPCRQLMDTPGYLFYNIRKLTGLTRSELPKLVMTELLTGASPPPTGERRFDVLVWQARIPPYTSYVAKCDIHKRRLLNKRRREHQDDVPSTPNN